MDDFALAMQKINPDKTILCYAFDNKREDNLREKLAEERKEKSEYHTSAQTWHTTLQVRQRSPSHLAESQRTPFLAMASARAALAPAGMAYWWAAPMTALAKHNNYIEYTIKIPKKTASDNKSA